MQLPNGATLDIASTYGTASVMSALTNASPAVGTLAASHGVAVNDIVEITSGWGGIDGQIAKASAVSTNDVTFLGIDTVGIQYPAGSGIGSVREITAWTQFPIVLDLADQGGEQQFWNFQPLSSYKQKQLPTVANAVSISFKIDDDITRPSYIAVRAAAKSKARTAFRLTLPNGSIVYWNGYVSITENSSYAVNVGMTYTVTLSLDAPVTRY